MPNATDEVAMSRIGIALVDGLCARARQVWRETPHSDVGLDGQIEFKEGERATGVFLGVQVKTGPSYISADGNTFVLNGDQSHFAYWASCNVPVIGVVVDPVSEIALWVDLTAECSVERIKNGPYTVRIPVSQATAFTIEALTGRLKSLASNYSNQRFTLWQLDALKENLAIDDAAPADAGQHGGDRLAWNMLCDEFSSEDVLPEQAASIGMRLAWYYPSVPDAFKDHLRGTLKQLRDGPLARAVGAARAAIEGDRPDVAELVADLLFELPGVRERLLSLLERAVLPRGDRDAAIQILEMWDEEPRDDLRRAYLP